jgi:hypothetical protein
VLISLGVAPVIYLLYAILATSIAIRANAPLKWKILTPLVVFMALPFMNIAALKFGEAGMDVLKYATSLMWKYHLFFLTQISSTSGSNLGTWSTTITGPA